MVVWVVGRFCGRVGSGSANLYRVPNPIKVIWRVFIQFCARVGVVEWVEGRFCGRVGGGSANLYRVSNPIKVIW